MRITVTENAPLTAERWAVTVWKHDNAEDNTGTEQEGWRQRTTGFTQDKGGEGGRTRITFSTTTANGWTMGAGNCQRSRLTDRRVNVASLQLSSRGLTCCHALHRLVLQASTHSGCMLAMMRTSAGFRCKPTGPHSCLSVSGGW